MAGIRMIDIAVNFTDGMFKGIYNGKQCHLADLSTVLSRAWAAGVDRIIVTGGSLEESREALAIAETDGRLFCTVGVHPTRCKEFEESGDPENHFQALVALAKKGIQKGKVVAVGECGLDYDRLHFCPAEIQKKYFEKQFELAHITKLPMFLHMRAAAADFCEIVEKNKYRFTAGVAHSFTGSTDDCNKLLSFDNMYIGINGCSLKTTENLDVVRDIPVEKMMIETDSPYCEIKNTHAGISFVKSTWPSKKKEKYDQEQVLEVVAGCKGINDVGNLSKTLYHNTCRYLQFVLELKYTPHAYTSRVLIPHPSLGWELNPLQLLSGVLKKFCAGFSSLKTWILQLMLFLLALILHKDSSASSELFGRPIPHCVEKAGNQCGKRHIITRFPDGSFHSVTDHCILC
ncbi:Putative deoxyribonuclease [Arachis hypogaea]|nr:Putative deoxyribonuclease [Arachis hypogaea]